jgi:hypothetical protein
MYISVPHIDSRVKIIDNKSPASPCAGMEPSKNVTENESGSGSCYKLQHLNIGSQKLQDSMFTLHIKSLAFLIKQVPLVVPCGKTGG